MYFEATEKIYYVNEVFCFRDIMSLDWKLSAVTRVSLKILDSEM